MRAFHRYLVLAAITLSLAGCRQADGPLPVPDEEVQNRLDDLSRDLASVAAGQPGGTKDFAEDLQVFTPEAHAAQGAAQLARSVAGVLSGTRLTDQTAQQLARHCWTAVAAQQMSARQVEALQKDMQTVLTSIGVSQDNARAATADVGTVQKLVTTRAKHWYEIF